MYKLDCIRIWEPNITNFACQCDWLREVMWLIIIWCLVWSGLGHGLSSNFDLRPISGVQTGLLKKMLETHNKVWFTLCWCNFEASIEVPTHCNYMGYRHYISQSTHTIWFTFTFKLHPVGTVPFHILQIKWL